MRILPRLGLAVPLAALLLASTVQPGSAILILPLNLGNPDISGYPAPFGSVEITRLTATTATISFISNLGPIGGYRYGFGDGSMAAFNLASGGSVSSFSATPAPWGTSFVPGDITAAVSGNVDGWGTFNTIYDDFDGFTHSVSGVTFNLTNSLANWTSDSDILTPNADGRLVAVHVFIANADNSNTNVTGYATNGNPVPEPSTILALGTGLVAFGAARKRRRRL